MASAAAAKKWPRPFQSRGRVAADQPEVRLVDQGGGLEGLARLLVGQPGGGELAQLVVDEREQLGRGLRVAGLDGGQDLGDVGHDRRVYPPGAGGEQTGVRPVPGMHPSQPAPVRHPALVSRPL